ncbi:cyclic pyranopterin monophosphate synthase accessory protein [Spirochaetia bacterium]|nr:cyclic pyranopterin monophosphate synthase accessory protein [Spirochaetia bacterium]
MQGFTHFDISGNAIMVDVGAKEVTQRVAVAGGRIVMQQQTLDAIKSGQTKKGDVLGVARIAGIMAAKKTAELIPLCHTLIFDSVTIDFDMPGINGINVKCTVKMSGKTGAEMEALTGVSVALLTIYDMCKAVDRGMDITDIHLLEKSGGKSGHWTNI